MNHIISNFLWQHSCPFCKQSFSNVCCQDTSNRRSMERFLCENNNFCLLLTTNWIDFSDLRTIDWKMPGCFSRLAERVRGRLRPTASTGCSNSFVTCFSCLFLFCRVRDRRQMDSDLEEGMWSLTLLFYFI